MMLDHLFLFFLVLTIPAPNTFDTFMPEGKDYSIFDIDLYISIINKLNLYIYFLPIFRPTC